MKTYYKRKLPHINPIGATYFVTFRLLNSIPRIEIQNLKFDYYSQMKRLQKIEKSIDRNKKILDHRKKYLAKYEDLLHKITNGPSFLMQEKIMNLVAEQMHRFDNELYNLVCFSIMSNHVHILIETNLSNEVDKVETFEKKLFDNHTHLSYIMQRIKGASARYINLELNQSGNFWEAESYDMYIRNEKMFSNVINYILQNPVKAGISANWEEYRGNYLCELNN